MSDLETTRAVTMQVHHFILVIGDDQSAESWHVVAAAARASRFLHGHEYMLAFAVLHGVLLSPLTCDCKEKMRHRSYISGAILSTKETENLRVIANLRGNPPIGG